MVYSEEREDMQKRSDHSEAFYSSSRDESISIAQGLADTDSLSVVFAAKAKAKQR